MGYSRTIAPLVWLTGEALAGAMSGLGMGIAAQPIADVNIEDVVLSASRLAMEEDDYRVLGVLVTWLDAHHARLNADRVIRVVSALDGERTRTFWAAMAVRWADDRRWVRLAQGWKGRRIDLLRVGSAFQLKRHGEDPRFAAGPLVVPLGVLRERTADVLAPAVLAERHAAYRLRVQMGPVYRADAWAVLEREPWISISELARRSYLSFATAWQVKHDHEIVHGQRDMR